MAAGCRRRSSLRTACQLLVLTCALGAVAFPRSVLAAGPLHVTLDPGHGGSEIGASYRFPDGVVLQEKVLTLRVAVRVRDLLQQAGDVVTLTRSSDSPVNVDGRDLNGDGRVGLADDLQGRVDLANQAGSDLFVSLHFNGSSDPTIRGTYTFWNPNRPFADRSRTLAANVQSAMIAALRSAGYVTIDRGVRTDAWLLGGDALFLLGPRSAVVARPSRMPAIISEPLFLTNPQDAAALRDDRVIEAVARGYVNGIRAYAASLAPTVPRPAPVVPIPQSAPSGTGAGAWSVWVITYNDTAKGRRLSAQTASELTSGGLASTVLASSGSGSPLGFRVVTSGRFDSRAAAVAYAARVRSAGYPDAYVHAVAAN